VSKLHENPKVEKQSGLNWRKANLENTEVCVMGENWEERLRDKDIEEAWRLFRGKVEQTVEKNVPRFVNIREKRQDWLTQDIVREIRKKKRL
jgi:hypothetical protein